MVNILWMKINVLFDALIGQHSCFQYVNLFERINIVMLINLNIVNNSVSSIIFIFVVRNKKAGYSSEI
jgi:hypothetical protein